MTKLIAGIVAILMTYGNLPAGAVEDSGHLVRIRASHQMRVCIWPDYYSISYRNTRTGKLEGVDIDLAHAFAHDLGVEPVFIDSSFRTMIEDLTTDRCDISMHGVGITPLRGLKLEFSTPYLRSGIYAITTKSHPVVKEWADIDRDGVVVVVQTGTYMVEAARTQFKAARVEEVQTPEAREQEIMSGRADVFLTDYPYSQKMTARFDWVRLLAPPQPLAPTDYAYAIAKGDAEWLAEINRFVARIKQDGRLLQAVRASSLEPIIKLD
jgi:ABC-type amino acid transport substrate-binding protein